MKIPDRMHDVHGWLPSSKLIPLDLQPAIGDLVVEKNMILKGDEVVQRHTGTQGSIVFIVRRPGWVLCREHGQQLTDLKQKKFAAEKQQDNTDGNNGTNTKNSDNQYLEGFELFGIVKETGVVRWFSLFSSTHPDAFKCMFTFYILHLLLQLDRLIG